MSTYVFPKPRRSIVSRIKAGIYVPTRVPVHEAFTRPKSGNFGRSLRRRTRGRLFTFPILWMGDPCKPLVETIVPSGAVSEGGDGTWSHTNSDIWNSVNVLSDAASAFTQGDGQNICGSKDFTTFIVALGNPVGLPGSSQCQGLLYVNRYADDTDTEDGCCNHSAILRELGSSRVVAGTESDIGGVVTFNHVASAAEIDAITNYNDLRSQNDKRIGKEATKINPPGSITSYTGVDFYAR